jgi:hypothetical protein
MDFILDYITVNTFWSILLIVHALLAVALLGAITHQAAAVFSSPRARTGGGFVTHFRAVSGPKYATAVCVLWVLAFIVGGWIYAKYRIYVRIPIEQEGFFKTQGVFELKEHLTTIGLGLLPFYWHLWKNAPHVTNRAAYDSARKWLTVALAVICWFAFLVGHVVNNVRGFGS